MRTSVTRLIRRATQSDAHSLARLRFAFRGPRAPTLETEQVFLDRCGGWMRERLGPDSVWRAWVVESDAGPVGNVWLQIVEKLPNPAAEPECHAYVSNLYIEPEYRNRGCGSALLREALAECARCEVDAVFLWPTTRSRSLYHRHGFVESGDVLVLAR